MLDSNKHRGKLDLAIMHAICVCVQAQISYQFYWKVCNLNLASTHAICISAHAQISYQIYWKVWLLHRGKKFHIFSYLCTKRRKCSFREIANKRKVAKNFSFLKILFCCIHHQDKKQGKKREQRYQLICFKVNGEPIAWQKEEKLNIMKLANFFHLN